MVSIEINLDVHDMSQLKLYSYWRSSAAYRLRIALNLKGVAYEYVPVNIAPGADEQMSDAYRALNPQMRVPAIEFGSGVIGQSPAILEWIEETWPTPALLPDDPLARLRCRAFADTIACDIHPLNNLSVLAALRADFGADDAAIGQWYASWILKGFAALEPVAASRTTRFAFGDTPGLAEVLLVPQVWNARRFRVDLSAFPALLELDAQASAIDAFARSAPEVQPDAPWT